MRKLWNHPLGRPLLLTLGLKIAALLVLWLLFVQPAKVAVDAERASAALLGPGGAR